MPAQHVVKAAAVLISINALVAPLPEVVMDDSTATFVEVLVDPVQSVDGTFPLATGTSNYGCHLD